MSSFNQEVGWGPSFPEWTDNADWEGPDEEDDEAICLTLLAGETAAERHDQGVPRGELASAASATHKRPGSKRFEIEERIGAGAFGVVFRAYDRHLQRHVAVKVLRPSLGRPRRLVKRFLREARAVASLNDPSIVQVFDVGSLQGHPYLVAELVEGCNLAQLLKREAELLPIETAVTLIRDVAHGVHFAHSRGVLHRDLKPSNMLLEVVTEESETESTRKARFRPKLTDFGLAKPLEESPTGDRTQLTYATEVLGTLRYLSPEQASGRGELLATTSDIFSLGIVFYEVLTGQPPFTGYSDVEVRRKICQQAPVRPRVLRRTLPRDIEAIVLRCLEKEPARRYASAAELAQDLTRYLNGQPVEASNPSLARRAWAMVRGNPVPTAVGAAVTLVVSAILGIAIGLKINAQQARERADRNLSLAAAGVGETLYSLADQINDGLPVTHEMHLQVLLKSLEVHRQLAEQNPESQLAKHRLQVSHFYVANAYGRLGKVAQAIEHRQDGLELLQDLLAAEPNQTRYLYDAFMAHYRMAVEKVSLSNQLVDFDIGTDYERARHYLQEVLAREPENVDARDAYHSLQLDIALLNQSEATYLDELQQVAKSAVDLWQQHPDRPLLIKHAVRARYYQGKHELERDACEAALITSQDTEALLTAAFPVGEGGREIDLLHLACLSQQAWALLRRERWDAVLAIAHRGLTTIEGLTAYEPATHLGCYRYQFSRMQQIVHLRRQRVAEADAIAETLQRQLSEHEGLRESRPDWFADWERVDLQDDEAIWELSRHWQKPL